MKLPKPTHEIYCSIDGCGEHYGWEDADDLTAQQMKRVTSPNDHRYIYTQDQVLEIIEAAARLCEKQDGLHDTLYASIVRKLKEQL